MCSGVLSFYRVHANWLTPVVQHVDFMSSAKAAGSLRT